VNLVKEAILASIRQRQKEIQSCFPNLKDSGNLFRLELAYCLPSLLYFWVFNIYYNRLVLVFSGGYFNNKI